MGKLSSQQVTQARSTYAGPLFSAVKSAVQSVQDKTDSTRFVRDTKSELYLLAISNMVSQPNYYEAAQDRDDRFKTLVQVATLVDPDWVAGFVPYLRDTMNMRTASVVMAAESALARKEQSCAPGTITVRQMVNSALKRPDEPAEFLAYWKMRTGKNPSGGVKRGIADAVVRMYTERNALKYDGVNNAWRLGDVLELVHPFPATPAQSDLFSFLLDRRHHSGDVRTSLERLPMIKANSDMRSIDVEQRRAWVSNEFNFLPQLLANAGMTWEDMGAWLNGPLDAKAWQAIIPSMGYMALIRNLRNFSSAGISKESADYVRSVLTDPAQVAKSKQFPIRFLSAYMAVEGDKQWDSALETAVNLSMQNVPSLPGRTLVLVDMSGSMFSNYYGYGYGVGDVRGFKGQSPDFAQKAVVFGAALALRADDADLVRFGSNAELIRFGKSDSLLALTANSIKSLGGTDTAGAIRKFYKGHDRVVILTDEQDNGYGRGDTGVPSNIPQYTFNLAGYRYGNSASGSANRHTFGGLTDAGFSIISMLEQHKSQTWPWVKQ